MKIWPRGNYIYIISMKIWPRQIHWPERVKYLSRDDFEYHRNLRSSYHAIRFLHRNPKRPVVRLNEHSHYFCGKTDQRMDRFFAANTRVKAGWKCKGLRSMCARLPDKTARAARFLSIRMQSCSLASKYRRYTIARCTRDAQQRHYIVTLQSDARRKMSDLDASVQSWSYFRIFTVDRI